jgi:acyl carrier protein
MGTSIKRQEVEATLLDAITNYGSQRHELSGSIVVSDLALDSLDLVELSLMVEERWGVELRARDMDALQTIGDIAELIVLRLK